MKITYTKHGNYLLPDLCLKERKRVKLGRYARMKLKFLKEENRPLYYSLLMKDELTDYLVRIEAEAIEMENNIINHMIKKLNVNEELKQKDQIKWVQMMNNISNCAFEMVYGKLIYSLR